MTKLRDRYNKVDTKITNKEVAKVKKYSIEKEIRKKWFYGHKATYKDQGDIKVLVWQKPGTAYYYVKYIFDGCKIYVSGDLGEAIFCFIETANIKVCRDYDLVYFHSKLSAYHEERYEFNSHEALLVLEEWKKELDKRGIQYDIYIMEELFKRIRECTSVNQWVGIVNNFSCFLSELDVDYGHWMYNIGNEIPMPVRGYLIGLKMAAEQLSQRG